MCGIRGVHRAQNNSWIYAGQGELSYPLLAGHDQLLEGQNVFCKAKRVLTKMLTSYNVNVNVNKCYCYFKIAYIVKWFLE